MTIAASIVAWSALSPLGRGPDAVSPGRPGERAISASFASTTLAAAGFARPFAAAVPGEEFPYDETRAEALFAAALGDLARALDDADPGWRTKRVGLAVGTSSGGMRGVERMVRAEGDERARLAESAMYFSPFAAALTELDVQFAPASLLLGACASSTLAVGLALRWLEDGACDLVIAGGFDAESELVAAGFEALRATTASAPPRPFRRSRDGLVIGEGAALLALVRADSAEKTAFSSAILGFGATCDAFHITAPDREGKGLARAGRLALADAGVAGRAIDLVSAHGTATPFNDAAEALALGAITEGGSPVVHAYKAQIGHTMGAAGALELLTALRALEDGILPATSGAPADDADGVADERENVRLLTRNEKGQPRLALKISSAFGGLNAALVAGPLGARATSSGRRHAREVYLQAAVSISPNDRLPPLNEAKVGRLDLATRLALAAALRLEEELGTPLAALHAGIVVGQTLASFGLNAAYAERIVQRGVRAAEPRTFPYTSPNAGAGETSIAFGLTGPSFAVGAGLHGGLEAALVAATLIRSGDAEAMVVVAVDAVGEYASAFRPANDLPAGAVALLLTTAPLDPARLPALRFARTELGFDRSRAREKPLQPGHLALLPLLAPASPDEFPSDKLSIRLESVCTSGAFASLELERV